MRFLAKVALSVVLLVLVVGAAFYAPPVQAQNNTALVTFYNNTSVSLTFSVDDIGGTCRVFVQYGSCQLRVAVGGHTLIARYNNGSVAASETITLSSGGFDWTIYEKQE